MVSFNEVIMIEEIIETAEGMFSFLYKKSFVEP